MGISAPGLTDNDDSSHQSMTNQCGSNNKYTLWYYEHTSPTSATSIPCLFQNSHYVPFHRSRKNQQLPMVDQWVLSIPQRTTVNIVPESWGLYRQVPSSGVTASFLWRGGGEGTGILPEDPVLTFCATYTPGHALFWRVVIIDNSFEAKIYCLPPEWFLLHETDYLVLDTNNYYCSLDSIFYFAGIKYWTI